MYEWSDFSCWKSISRNLEEDYIEKEKTFIEAYRLSEGWKTELKIINLKIKKQTMFSVNWSEV